MGQNDDKSIEDKSNKGVDASTGDGATPPAPKGPPPGHTLEDHEYGDVFFHEHGPDADHDHDSDFTARLKKIRCGLPITFA